MPERLLTVHQQLDHDCRHRGRRIFVGDWYCEHPFISKIISEQDRGRIDNVRLAHYYFPNDKDEIHRAILEFHRRKHEVNIETKNIFITSGLSPLITAQMYMLARMKIRKIFYVKPLYYTYYFHANTLGMELIPINAEPLIGDMAPITLPESRNCPLILCDPIWFMGRYANNDLMEILREWQEATRNLIFVDGAFQYQRWDNNQCPEQTSKLCSELTIRNVCPTKIAALHGPRFAYAIVPEPLREELRYCHSNVAGSGSAFDFISAIRIMKWLNSTSGGQPLLDFTRKRYEKFIEVGLFSDVIGAEASYFCFVDIHVAKDKLISMGQEFFDTSCYPEFVRFNLLLPYSELMRLLNHILPEQNLNKKPHSKWQSLRRDLKKEWASFLQM